MIACLKPTLWYILGDFYMQQLSKHTYLNYNLQTSLGFTSLQYENSDRLQAITKNGRARCSIKFPEFKKGEYSVRKEKTSPA